MQIKMTMDAETTTHKWRKGAIVDVPDAIAKRFIEGGAAELVKEPEPEQAMMAPRKTAVKKGGRPRVQRSAPTGDAAAKDD